MEPNEIVERHVRVDDPVVDSMLLSSYCEDVLDGISILQRRKRLASCAASAAILSALSDCPVDHEAWLGISSTEFHYLVT